MFLCLCFLFNPPFSFCSLKINNLCILQSKQFLCFYSFFRPLPPLNPASGMKRRALISPRVSPDLEKQFLCFYSFFRPLNPLNPATTFFSISPRSPPLLHHTAAHLSSTPSHPPLLLTGAKHLHADGASVVPLPQEIFLFLLD